MPFGCYEQRRDDTYMVRIRATGGAVTPAQLRAIGEISERYRSPSIHVTTRQEFQIHDLDLESVVPAMRDLLAAGLSTRGGGGNTVRNIMISPGAGVEADEVFDPSGHAFALTDRLIAEGDSWNLPRKLKIAFSNSEADTAYAEFNDLGFVARIENGVRGFRVFVAGGLGTKPEVGHLLHDFVPETDVYLVAAAVKRLFDKNGNRKNRNAARLRFLWRKIGAEAFRTLYEAERAALAAGYPSPLVVKTFPEGARPAVAAARDPDDAEAFALWRRRYVEPQPQPGLVLVVLPASLGNLGNADMVRLAEFLEPLGPHTVRATFGQNLRLRNIPESLLPDLWALVRGFDPLASRPRTLADAIACTGADICKLGMCRPKGALAAITGALAESGLGLDEIPGFRLNVSGCPNTCGQHMLADLGLFGGAGRKGQRLYPAYMVVAGAEIGAGRARLARSFARVPARDLPKFVVDVARTWLAKRGAYASFADYVDGEGADDIRAAVARFADVPAFEDDKNYYYDWGDDEVFSFVGRGSGECSAGLFDLIDVDLKGARALVALPPEQETLRELALRCARALLITRGIEPADDGEVFAYFTKHFISAGLIPERFRAAVVTAQKGAPLGEHHGDLVALLRVVEELYDNMDASLRFPGESGAVAFAVPVAALERDYSAVACPLNFVKVKFDLETIRTGETLKVILGDGEPIRNVPPSIASEGHKVLSQTRTGDVWEVLIEKV